jgi:predicted nucleic acid-binding protein
VIYFDTSYLVKCYLLEHGSSDVRQLLTSPGIGCSALGRLELVAAFHRKLREGKIDQTEFSVLHEQLEFDDSQGLWTWLPLTSRLLDDATARFLTLPANCFVRSADALHLVCALESGCTSIYSNDKHLLNAAVHFGIRAQNVIV